MKTFVKQKYIVTSVQRGAIVEKNFLQNINLFCVEEKVDKILVFVMNGRYKDDDNIDPILYDMPNVEFVTRSKKLNKNLNLFDSKILPQAVEPFRGLPKKIEAYTNIVPSAKVRYQSVASASQVPRALIATGAMTQPSYKENTMTGRVALEQHQLGFTYVVVESTKTFTPYLVRANKQGNFYFLNKKYYNGKVTNDTIEAYVLGDIHGGEVDEWVLKQSFKDIELLKPKRVILHDLFDGESINHWTRGKLLDEIRLSKSGNELEKEVKVTYRLLKRIANTFSKIEICVVYSNHDVRLESYINSKEFVNDPQNFLFISKLIPSLFKVKAVVLQEALKLIGKIPSNVRFFKRDEEFRVRGILLSHHGHKGVNGSRGVPKSYENTNARSITGHTHSPLINSNSMVVGTCTPLKLNYNSEGQSSWLNANGILYKDGSFTLTTIIKP